MTKMASGADTHQWRHPDHPGADHRHRPAQPARLPAAPGIEDFGGISIVPAATNEDLTGKTVAVAGPGATIQFVPEVAKVAGKASCSSAPLPM